MRNNTLKFLKELAGNMKGLIGSGKKVRRKPMRKSPSLTKQKHEVRKYLHHLSTTLYSFAARVQAYVDSATISISQDGKGEIYLPAHTIFEKLTPQSDPAGLIFRDGSFLVFQEIVHFGYRNETDSGPTIYRTRYSYHYQRPTDYFYFRYDHHPDIGDPETHPLHHLHSAGWQPGGTQFQEVPRYEVNEMTLDKTLRLILINFPTVRI
jgi:hypothetical protein